MSWRRIGIVARREFLSIVRRREFLLITFGLPLLYALLIGGVSAATGAAVGEAAQREAKKARVIGWVDHSHLLKTAALEKGGDDLKGRVFPDEKSGQDAVRSGAIRGLVVVPADFAKSGAVTVYLPEARDSLFGAAGEGFSYVPVLRRSLLAGRVPDVVAERVVEAPDATRLRFDSKTGAFARPNPFQMIARFAVPYAVSLLLLISVLFSSSYLLHGIVEEKESRVIEVLLSAASHEELLLGKLIGLGGAGLAQLGLWMLGGGVTALVAVQAVRQLSGVSVSPGIVGAGILFFALGFVFYAALMAGIGSFGTSWRESQQISSTLVFMLMLPLFAIAAILESPDGPLARVLSFVPPTAPIAMVLRIAAGGAPPWEVALSALLLAASAYATVRLAARLFRLSLLLYGQRPSIKEVVRWLRYRPAPAPASGFPTS